MHLRAGGKVMEREWSSGKEMEVRRASWEGGHNKTFIVASKHTHTHTLTPYTPTHPPHPHLSLFSLFWERWGGCQDVTHTPSALECDRFLRSANKSHTGLLIIPLYLTALRPHLLPVWPSSSFVSTHIYTFFFTLISFDLFSHPHVMEHLSSHCHYFWKYFWD